MDKKIMLHGVQPAPSVVQQVTFDKVSKWPAGNDIWAIAMVEMLPADHTQTQHPEVQKILQEFQDVFQETKTIASSYIL